MELSAYESMRDSEESHWWFVGRRAVIRSLIDRFVKPQANAAILEAGCGFGGNLSLLQGYGRLHAFEYNDDARAYAARRTSAPIAFGALPAEIGFGDTKFELIALLDVLEHIDDDLATLRALRGRLSDSGALLITVPAVPALWSNHDVVHHHKRRYSKLMLNRRLAEAGLVAERIGYFNSFLFPLAVLERVASRLFGGGSDHNVTPPKPVNRLLAKIFALEAKLLGRVSFPIGLSLYAVVRKSPDPA